MNALPHRAATLLLLTWAIMSSPESQAADAAPQYPASRQAEQVDDYHGTRVADPYRWLEDPDSPESRAWIEAQNKLTNAWLAEVPGRDKIRARLEQLWNYERYSTPFREGGRYFYSKNDGLQNQSVLYTTDKLDQSPKLLLDPNKLSADGTVALGTYAITDDGQFMAYGLSTAGSDWIEFKIKNVATGEDLPDHLKWAKFTGASWLPDGSGFYYSRYDEPAEGTSLRGVNYFQKLYFHKRGTPQSQDRLVYERRDEKEWGFHGRVTDDGAYLIISVTRGTDPKNLVFYQQLARDGKPEGKVVELIREWDADYTVIDNDGPVLWVRTDLDAPRGRVISIDLRSPERANWKELIPQVAETLGGVNVVGNRFVASYLKDARSQVKLFGLDGKFEKELELPGIGSAGGFGGKRKDQETFYSFSSFTFPTTAYRYDFETGQSSVVFKPKVAFNPDGYEVKQVFFTSRDGTQVPMFLSYKKGLVRDGSNATLLYAYGGFNISLTPSFSVANLVWMELGGIYAVPNLRGGGEYGEEWHKAGNLKNKQNVFDDFIAAAEWLIAEKYTSREKLAIAGGSNGGLLVGACMTQRPELFAAALPAVGVMDMLRFHKFTIGWAWVSEYGSAEDAEMFPVLYKYSPLHRLKAGTSYPATMVTTGDHDDRVVPAHSFKFAAALQAAQKGPAPALIRIETRAGHGAGKPTAKILDELADKWAFLVRVLKMKE